MFYLNQKKIYRLEKMKLHFIFLALFLTSNSISCFKANDFCKKAIGFKKCVNYNCGTLLCSTDREACRNLISWGVLMKKYAKETPNKYTQFVGSIKPCVKEYKNQWSHRMNFG
jgi:hypothetical protein